MRKRTALGVESKVRVTLMNLLVAMATDLSSHIRRNIGVRQLGNKRVAQRMKSKHFELTTFALLSTPRSESMPAAAITR